MTSTRTMHPWRPRSLARQLAVQLLYQDELNPSGDATGPGGDELIERAGQLLRATLEEEADQPPTG
ncbi:MAG TPA: hypothetical protein EYP56_12690, partial [Planctomycetaceae bacterium]|nr:hypothetical protein [Planctomycetaceae bacterium]